MRLAKFLTPRSLAIGAIRGYRLVVSPFLPMSCRFHPTCSAYGIEAIARHGAVAGLWLTLRRIARCHPWNGGGLDPVPQDSPLAGLARLTHLSPERHD